MNKDEVWKIQVSGGRVTVRDFDGLVHEVRGVYSTLEIATLCMWRAEVLVDLTTVSAEERPVTCLRCLAGDT